MEKLYLEEINLLGSLAKSIPNTPMMAYGKVLALLNMNLRYEPIKENRQLDTHPYSLVRDILLDTIRFMEIWADQASAEHSEKGILSSGKQSMEEMHRDLFQNLWQRFNKEEYDGRVDRYVYRLELNNLEGFIDGAVCMDFGCGHGNFAHALLRKGAKSVLGIDYGEGSIKYARAAADSLGVDDAKLKFAVASVYETGVDDLSVDFALQNGVFHHLDDEDKAYSEVARVLKPGGWFWVYTTGEGAIANDLWGASTEILKDIPQDFVVEILKSINLSVGKRYILGDGMNAIYRRTSWNEITSRLDGMGFGNFKRLTGGYETDFDLDVIEADRYGIEKFGEGDLRFLAQKLG